MSTAIVDEHMGDEQGDQTGPLLAVADQTRSLALTLGRDDLARRLDQTMERLQRPGVRLLIVGEFKQGKSTLTNALLGKSICPVDDDVATAVLTYISHSAKPWARAYRREGEIGTVVEQFDPGDAPLYVSEAGNPGNERKLVRVEFGLPAPMLQGGLVLVDTPGVGGLESSHGAITIGALAEADAVVFVSDASQELTKPELDFLRHAHELCPTVIHVVSKIDLYPEWRRVLDLSRHHLADSNLHGPVIGVSSTLFEYASKIRDVSLVADSGMSTLTDTLARLVIEPGRELAVRIGLRDVLSCAGQLAAPVETEHAILEDPSRASQVVRDFETARARASELQGQSSGWQLTLSDGVADLSSDIDHDLRARTRRLIQESEATIDQADPADMWHEFEAELYSRATNDIVENFTMLTHRVDELAGTVETHFTQAEHALAQAIGVSAPVGAIKGLTLASTVDVDRPGVLSQGMTGLRGSYGGVLMFSMIGNMVGMAAMNPAILVVGLLMGRKSLREEKKRQLTTRRQQAKSAVRKYIDELSFQVGKDSRDSLRITQRELRDHFTTRAAELTRSTQDALRAAQSAAKVDDQTRKQRSNQLSTYRARLSTIEEQCQGISAGLEINDR